MWATRLVKLKDYSLILLCVLILSCTARGQDQAQSRVWTASVSYSPDSSHILIGDAEQRRIFQVSADYGVLLEKRDSTAVWFTSGVVPVMVESDPAVVGLYDNAGLPVLVQPVAPYDRPVKVSHDSVGEIGTPSGTTYPIYQQYGRLDTYAFGLDLAGIRLVVKPARSWNPVLSASGGLLYAGKPIPSEADTRFNFQFKLGAGIEHRIGKTLAARCEYLYQHISNAEIGQDPGIDSGTFRLSFSKYTSAAK